MNEVIDYIMNECEVEEDKGTEDLSPTAVYALTDMIANEIGASEAISVLTTIIKRLKEDPDRWRHVYAADTVLNTIKKHEEKEMSELFDDDD